MARADFGIETSMDGLYEMMEKASKPAPIIDEVLKDYGGPEIESEIMPLIPISGRDWQGKKKAAAKAKPFREENKSLMVTVRTKYAYHYLYFPDDGSTTVRHVGDQGFMQRGLDTATPSIIEKCIGALTDALE